MAAGWLLTVLALAGVVTGVYWGRAAERLSGQLAAVGGGLLMGISVFWLVPEIAHTSGPGVAVILTIGVALILALLDGVLTHSGHSMRERVVWPLLLATAVHSLLDGWSVRMLGERALADVAVVVGLALHKIPEGAAIGWVTRRRMGSARRALSAAVPVELFTLAGAFGEPALNRSGLSRFGVWWTGVALSVIAGGFLFLALHAILPVWKRWGLMVVFVAAMVLVGLIGFVRSGGV